MRRRICYITGTRADFSPMKHLLLQANRHPDIELQLCVTGMHLSASFGLTIREIENSGLRIMARVPVDLEAGNGASMARGIAHQIAGITSAFEVDRPDLVLLMGDRGEMLAGALAALHLNILIAHVHGGERSGTVDEPVRHAISKLSHYHFVSTEGSRERLIRMGEAAGRIWVTGAPGLDDIPSQPAHSRQELFCSAGFDPLRPLALVVYHPVLQTSEKAGAEMLAVLGGTAQAGVQMLCLQPNSDAGFGRIRDSLNQFRSEHPLRIVTHFERTEYLSWLAAADVMVGNSSSGIIEAASFGTPVINVGDRQFGRERNANTRDVSTETSAIAEAVLQSIRKGRFPRTNVYGDGMAGQRITSWLATIPLDSTVLRKCNEY